VRQLLWVSISKAKWTTHTVSSEGQTRWPLDGPARQARIAGIKAENQPGGLLMGDSGKDIMIHPGAETVCPTSPSLLTVNVDLSHTCDLEICLVLTIAFPREQNNLN
jgi:hypothetical protein